MYRHHIAARRAPLFCEEDWHLTHGCKMTIWCVHISVLMTPVWRDLKRKGTMSPFFLQHFLDGGFNVLCFPSLISKNAMITPIDEVLGGWGFCCWKIPFRGPLELRSLDYWCGSPVDGPTQIFFCKTWQNILTKTWKYDQFDHHLPPKNGSYQIKRGHSPFEKTNPKDLQGCSKLAAGLGTSEGQNLIGTHSSPNCPKWCWSYITTFCWALLKFF